MIMKNTVATFKKAKLENKKLTMLTAYDYSTAKLMDEAGINGILVGDSLGMVMLGYEDTLPVTMEDMIHHTKAVAKGAKNALIIADMPFMSYQTSVYDAVKNAGRLIKEGCAHAVKLEGGEEVCPQIKAIVDASIPVMAHIGLTPQSVNVFGGFKVQGKEEDTARKLIEAAKAVEKAGAFSVTLEGIPAKLAQIITRSISIPTIGIGAGNGCDGQVLVYQDMLGMFSDFVPKFVKRYANIGEEMKAAFAKFIEEVQEGVFPGEEHSYSISDEVIDKLYEEYGYDTGQDS
jgi:3-methyl-2-oxobutanoate hydroxymethyltransferase